MTFTDDRIEFLIDQAERGWTDHPFGPPGGTVRSGLENHVSDIDNPFWELVSLLPAEPFRLPGQLPAPTLIPSLDRMDLSRHHMVKEFAFAIPSPADIDWIQSVVGSRRIVEVMSGTGYWTYLLRQVGIDVTATDIHPVARNEYRFTRQWDEVEIADAADAAATAGRDDVLMMIWPGYNQDTAKRALDAFTGDHLIYGGETFGGACADAAFWDSLESDWEYAGRSHGHITWDTIHCELQLWTRR